MTTLEESININTPPSTGVKLVTQLLIAPMEAAWFVLFWNVLGVDRAVGHGLGTVNYWTALGVNFVVSGIVAAFALAFWSAKFIARRYSVYTNDND